MQKVMLAVVITFSEEEKKYLTKKFSRICAPAMKGDKERFDQMCTEIPAFCEEIYQMGKNMRWPPDPDRCSPHIETPNDMVIYSVGSNIGAIILPLYRGYTAKSEALHKMVCDVIAEEKYEGGRYSFITEIWPKTKRTDGVDIQKLFNSKEIHDGIFTVWALLKFRDGRFVKEVKKLQERLPDEMWIVHKKKIALYLERYGE